MLQSFTTTELTHFDRVALAELAPYFDLNFAQATDQERRQWFLNLFQLSQHSLGLAHCVHHNHTARLTVTTMFDLVPDFFQRPYQDIIGCYCGHKSTDSIQLDGDCITGTKQWISMVDQADFGVFRIADTSQQLHYVLVDFAQVKYTTDMNSYVPLGMELARPGSFTVDCQTVPEQYILMPQGDPRSFVLSSFHDYCFITNYLGCATALFRDVEQQHLARGRQDCEFDRLKLQLSTLHLLWQHNLDSVQERESSDKFWHQRNTQYVQGKALIVDLVRYILLTGSSYHLNLNSAHSQRFRDALMLTTHMKSVADNAQDLHFYKISL